MHKQIALAYSIAGIAVAVALLVTYGSQERALGAEPSRSAPTQDAAPAPTEPPSAADPVVDEGAAQPVEYVYVEAPRRSGRVHHDDDHEDGDDDGDGDDDEHERNEHRERESE